MAFLGQAAFYNYTPMIGNSSEQRFGNKSSGEWGFYPRSSDDLYFSMAFLILLSAVITIGNILVIASYKYNIRLRTGTTKFLISLAVSDLLVGAISIPMWIYMRATDKQDNIVLVYFFTSFDVFSACASIMHLAAISVERYNATLSPFRHTRFSSRTRSYMIAAAWAYAILLASLFPVQLAYQWTREYTLLVITTSYIFPFLIIFIMYCIIFNTSKLPNILKQGCSKAITGRKLNLQRERKVAVTVALITFLFLLAWTPFFIVSVMAVFCGPECLPGERGLMWLVDFVKWLHYSNSGVNPLIYGFRCIEMRKTFGFVMHRVVGVVCSGNDMPTTLDQYKIPRRS